MLGDDVEIENIDNQYVINSVYQRKNSLIRPTVANIDQALILASSSPMVDMLLIDKVLINCFMQNITPIIIINKSDIVNHDFVEEIKSNFSNVCDIFVVSCKTSQGLSGLNEMLKGKTNCLVGQSAVGKTTLINLLVPHIDMLTGELSIKSGRGKHTTRHSQLFSIDSDTFIIDTPGFSLLQLELKPQQLSLYYPDIFQFSQCKYNMCAHINEPDCAVKKAVAEGNLSATRYQRYCQLYKQLEELYDNKY